MTHWEVSNLLTDYVEGTLDQGPKGLMDEHLASCGDCRAMAEDVRFALRTLHAAEDAEPAPWLESRILLATTGSRRRRTAGWAPSWLRAAFRPQVAYGISMAVFSLSFLFYAANVNLQGLKLRELNPVTWVYRADSRGHLLVARAEKFYYDLRFVYEVQSLLRQMRQQPEGTPGSRQKPQAPDGGASGAQSPGAPQMALERRPALPPFERFQKGSRWRGR
ncbi:MAG TPA: zf-HC2 domain-containing protein [Terriglobia bacterium]|nr:zf-HC2 domain-containing protein [Terriglobia bacterium]